MGEGCALSVITGTLAAASSRKGITVTHDDNWGWRARIGLFIVGSEAVPEAGMVGDGAAGRVGACRAGDGADAWAKWRADKSGVDLADDLARGARQFSTMRLQAVVFAHTSSSVVGGKGWDEATVAALSSVVRSGIAGDEAKVTTNGLDTLAALRHSGVKRPFLVVPPWFPDDTVGAALRYYGDHGITPAGHLRLDPGRKWRDVPPQDLYPQGMGFEQEIEPLYAQIRKACPADADGVLIGGTGFRCVGILETLEKRPRPAGDQRQPGEPVALPQDVAASARRSKATARCCGRNCERRLRSLSHHGGGAQRRYLTCAYGHSGRSARSFAALRTRRAQDDVAINIFSFLLEARSCSIVFAISSR